MRPQIESRTPGVIDGLMAIFDGMEIPKVAGGDEMTKVELIDGPPSTAGANRDNVLNVAPGDPGEAGVMVDRIPQTGLGRMAYLERTEVTMLVSCYSGSKKMKRTRDQAAAVLNAAKVRVDENLTRDDAWEKLYLGAQEIWHQVQNAEGVTVYIGFTVVAESVG